MVRSIQHKRGPEEKIPVLKPGEFALATDTEKLFVGTDNGNIKINGGHLTEEITTELEGKAQKTRVDELSINIKDFGAVGDGKTDDTSSFQRAVDEANKKGVPLFLPVGEYLISKSINNILSLKGVPGKKSVIILASDFTKSGFANQFCFTNPNFTNGGFNPNTANSVDIENLLIKTSPNAPRSVFGFANIKSLNMDNVDIIATKVINAQTGRPNAVDALIDLYACVKNAKIRRCKLQNLTYARGPAYSWSEGGGGCIWVRNLLGSATAGAIDLNATENIDIRDCELIHATSDEALAVYGVVGKTRKVNVINNRIYGVDIDPQQIVFHNTLVSVFPLKHSTLGQNALVEDVLVADNYIESKSFFYSVVRYGNTGDISNICQRIKSSRNTIVAIVSSDPTYGPQAQWVANGSPAGHPAPNLNTLALRAVKGSAATFRHSNASIDSDNDTLVCTGNVNWGITGFDNVSNPTIKGSAYYGIISCTNVIGGNVESSSVAFYNCNNVENVMARTNMVDGSSCIAFVDSVSGRYNLKGVYGTSGGGLCRSSSSTTSSTIIDIILNSVNMSNSSVYAVNNSGQAIVTARLNTISGLLSGGILGNVTSSLNRWGNITD